eukprot:982295-Pleurochrysis_carterae.AAC.1
MPDVTSLLLLCKASSQFRNKEFEFSGKSYLLAPAYLSRSTVGQIYARDTVRFGQITLRFNEIC